MGFSNIMIQAAKSIPKSTITQSMPSLTYSSCSTTNIWWLKNCCSFSLTKLMEICSKPLYSKISKPAMSSTAQKLAFFMVGSIRVSLHLMISHLKMRSKMARAIPPVDMVACSQVWPLVTHSVPRSASFSGKGECSFVQTTCTDSTLCGKMPLYQQLGKKIPTQPKPGLFPWQINLYANGKYIC